MGETVACMVAALREAWGCTYALPQNCLLVLWFPCIDVAGFAALRGILILKLACPLRPGFTNGLLRCFRGLLADNAENLLDDLQQGCNYALCYQQSHCAERELYSLVNSARDLRTDLSVYLLFLIFRVGSKQFIDGRLCSHFRECIFSETESAKAGLASCSAFTLN